MITESTSIIIPAYNEEEVIGSFLLNLKEFMLSNFIDYEIIVVNDCSSDKTKTIVEEIEGIKLISHPYNKGNGATVRTGIRNSEKKFVIMMDSDGQHDPKNILQISELLNTYDCVVGARDNQSQANFYRNIANNTYNLLASYVTNVKIEDLTSGYRGFRREVIKNFLYLFPNGFSYPTTSTMAIIKAGYNIKYFPIKANKRVGTSKIKIFKDGFRFLMIIFKLTTLFSPLKIFIPASALFVSMGLFHIINRLLILGNKYTEFSVFLISIGVLIFLIGLVSEQITTLRYDRSEE